MGQISDATSFNLLLLTENIRDANASVRIPQIQSRSDLIYRLDSLSCNLTQTYTSHFWEPAKKLLLQRNNLYNEVITDVSQAILQHSSNFEWGKTLPLQQLSCDMWNTFVTSSGHCTTKHCLPPIVKWGEHASNYAISDHNVAARSKLPVPIISFSTKFLNDGILAWPVMMHETAHTILESGDRLSPALTDAVDQALKTHNFNRSMRKYWSNKIEEAAADVMSVLYMGPIAAVGLMARFKGRNNRLSNNPSDDAVHPAGVLRILILAYVVRELNIQDSQKWFEFLISEVRKDFNGDELEMEWESARDACKCIAFAIMNEPILGDRSLKSIRCWNDADEDCVREFLGQPKLFSHLPAPQFKTPHIVAAANQHLLTSGPLLSSRDSRISKTFNNMLQFIKIEAEKPCNTCSLTSREVYQVCHIPPAFSTVSVLPEERQETQNKGIDWGKVLLGLAIGAIVVGGVAVAVNASNNSKNRSRRTVVATSA